MMSVAHVGKKELEKGASKKTPQQHHPQRMKGIKEHETSP
jgi:hypothetical protein